MIQTHPESPMDRLAIVPLVAIFLWAVFSYNPKKKDTK